MNVKTSWESSLWIADGVTQLLSTKNLKEIVGKDKLVRSKLLEELNSLFLFSGGLVLLQLATEILFFYSEFSDPPPSFVANGAIYRGFRG